MTGPRLNITTDLPSGRRGQLLALAMLVVAVLIVWLGAGAPLSDWYFERAARLDAQRVLVERMASLAASLPELSRAPGREADNRAQTDALAAAGLEQHLVRLAADAGTEIASAETLAAEPAGGLRRIRLRVALTASWPVLLKLLGAIETDGEPLLIDDVELHVDASSDPDQPVLQARFSVIALRAGAASAPAP